MKVVANISQTLSSQQKVDDDDGHFIVNDNTDLTERCKSFICASHLFLVGNLFVDIQLIFC